MFKKVARLPQTKQHKIEFIKTNRDNIPLNIMLEKLDLNKSYWDKYKNYNFYQDKDEEITKIIVEVFNENRKEVGYRIITKKIKSERKIIVNHKKVLRIMKKNNIQAEFVRKMIKKAQQSKRKKQNTVSYPDLVKRNFKGVTTKFSVLYTDVTYLILGKQKRYQSTIIDGFTKEIIDYKISKRNDNKLVMSNLKQTIKNIKQAGYETKNIIIHSDHGYQYTSKEYAKICKKNKLLISMGNAYTCADNIVIESFHSLLKKGTIHNNFYKTIEEYVADVVQWNNYYNHQRKKGKDF